MIPFQPLVSKDSQLPVALLLVLTGSLPTNELFVDFGKLTCDIGLSLTGVFSISMPTFVAILTSAILAAAGQ